MILSIQFLYQKIGEKSGLVSGKPAASNRKSSGLWVLAAVVWMSVHTLHAQKTAVELAGKARFILHDSMAYLETGYDDRGWQEVEIPAPWSRLGLGPMEKRTGWYRIHFTAPPAYVKTDCILFAGIIDDADECYLNGTRIGATGQFPPADQSAWDVQRRYALPKGLLQTENVLAFRVYNGIGDGGLYAGEINIRTQAEYDRELKYRASHLDTYHQMTTSNGLVAAVYNETNQTVEAFYPHIFSYHDSAKVVLPVLTELRPSLDLPTPKCGYLQQTHVIEAVYKSFTLYYFCSFTRKDPVLYILAKGQESALNRLDFQWKPGSGTVTKATWSTGAGPKALRCFAFTFTDPLHPVLPAVFQDAGALLSSEIAFMRSIIDQCRLPAALTKAERKVAEQSVSVLKMAQVAENEVYPRAPGQVLASLRPGVWAISWVRDAAYAISAMNHIGMYDEARKALEFMLKAQPSSQYVHFIHSDGKDYGIGVPYQISVTRYFGNGREESDYADGVGPNIEIDDFGLFLIAFCDYVRQSGDQAFFQKWRVVVREKVARPILHNLGADDILRRDSGPWEHHLPGKQFVFTNGVCARGLQLLAELQRASGAPDTDLEAGAQRMLRGLEKAFLVDGAYFKGNAQEQSPTDRHYFDAASFELFACGLFDDKRLFAEHMAVYDRHLLAAKDPQRGYIRFDSQDSYENQEWPFAGLRVAVSERKLGNLRRAKQLIDRITRFASQNHGLIPEIIGLEWLEYKGAIPMVGYGAGAYLLALDAYYSR